MCYRKLLGRAFFLLFVCVGTAIVSITAQLTVRVLGNVHGLVEVAFGQVVLSSLSLSLGPIPNCSSGSYAPIGLALLHLSQQLSLDVSSEETQDVVLDSSLSVTTINCSTTVSAGVCHKNMILKGLSVISVCFRTI